MMRKGDSIVGLCSLAGVAALAVALLLPQETWAGMTGEASISPSSNQPTSWRLAQQLQGTKKPAPSLQKAPTIHIAPSVRQPTAVELPTRTSKALLPPDPPELEVEDPGFVGPPRTMSVQVEHALSGIQQLLPLGTNNTQPVQLVQQREQPRR